MQAEQYSLRLAGLKGECRLGSQRHVGEVVLLLRIGFTCNASKRCSADIVGASKLPEFVLPRPLAKPPSWNVPYSICTTHDTIRPECHLSESDNIWKMASIGIRPQQWLT